MSTTVQFSHNYGLHAERMTKRGMENMKKKAKAEGKGVSPAAAPLTVIEQSLKSLRRLIMNGELKPGQKLVEISLCASLGVSRASLREALRIMEREHLIDLIPNRGPSVAKLGWQEIEEIHDVWAMLTSEAVYRFVERAKPEQLDAITTAATELQQSMAKDSAVEQLDATNRLFAIILDSCGNSVLVEIVYGLVSRLNFLRARALQYEGWGALCLHEIGEIVAAIQARNPIAARDATRRHIDSACAAAKQVALLASNRPAQRGRGAHSAGNSAA
jgi:DNA-binding GntR family transcriptional regulator